MIRPNMIAEYDFTPQDVREDPVCQGCGDDMSHRIVLYSDEGNVYVYWNDMTTYPCPRSVMFEGTAEEFFSEYRRDDSQFPVDDTFRDEFNDFILEIGLLQST